MPVQTWKPLTEFISIARMIF